MSIFASLVTKTLPVHGTSETITIRKLAPKALDKAREASRRAAAAELRLQRETLGDQQVRELQEEIAKVAASGEAERRVDPLGLYDQGVLVREGVAAWSFAAIACTPDACDDIDEDRREWLAREILRLSKPSLFQTAAEQEADQKNA